MKIDTALLDDLSSKAKANPRLRQAYDLRTTPNDQSQRILNALEPDTVVPIHRHLHSTETVVLLRGKVRQFIYDDRANVIDSYVVEANSPVCGYSIPLGQWHATQCLESGTIMLECKDGPYEPLSEENILKHG
ncbi:MAG: WbuC family cupin fold metalloprotein [Paludibacteraceae bacterium]|nr:WbuC family cupin fold metalloprotein [Paludibacteraceae bacterium]MBR4839885.1 WbuC family cupin fold metalloprotein [Paludibacteraceae bacterium]